MALVPAPSGPGNGRRSVSLHGIVEVGRDPWESVWVASNVLTEEQVALPYPISEDVFTVVDDDGDGVFSCDAEDSEPLVIEHIMNSRAECVDGCYFLQEKGEGDKYSTLGSMEQLACAFDLGSITCEFGDLRTSQAVEVAVFDRPRGLCRIFWCLLSVNKVANFGFSSGFASTWLHKNLPSWSSMLEQLSMCGSLLKSRPCGGPASSHADRPTPFVAVSSKGLVALLLSWGYSSQRWCGMKCGTNAAAARCFLEGWLAIVYTEQWELRIFLCAHAEIRSPRPWRGDYPVSLQVSADGLVRLKEMRELSAGALQKRDPKAKFAAYLISLCGEVDEAPLVPFLGALAMERRNPWALSLFTQCVHRVGERLDGVVVSMLDSEYTHPSSVLTISGADVSSDYRLDRTLRKYTAKSQEVFCNAKFLSVAADSSRVGTQALQNAMMVDDANCAAWLVPQVVEDYTDDVEVAEMIGGPAATEEALEGRRKRQRAWVERSAESDPSEWRAMKRPRVATYNFIRYLDNQVLYGTGQGLAQFQQPEKFEERLPADEWPKVCVALDQHATQLAAVAYMQRKLCINLEVAWDLAHGNWRDIICSLKDINYWPSMLLAMVAYNTPCGPWEDDARFQQCKSAMVAMFKRTKPDNSPLFLQLLPQLLHESGSEAAVAAKHPEDFRIV